jgi:hypothetical protein
VGAPGRPFAVCSGVWRHAWGPCPAAPDRARPPPACPPPRAALHLTNFSLNHLLICWTALTSLHFDARGPAVRPEGGGWEVAGLSPLTALVHAASLRDLSINLFDTDADADAVSNSSGGAARGVGGGDGGSGGAPGAPTACGAAGGSEGGAAFGAVDWGCLPPRLESLSISGIQIDPSDLSAMAQASPHLE